MTGTGTQTQTTGVTTIALLVLRTGELKTSHKTLTQNVNIRMDAHGRMDGQTNRRLDGKTKYYIPLDILRMPGV